jgi:protein translocase SecG subunit
MKNLNQILTFLSMILAVLNIFAIALQNKSSGLSNVFGGVGQVTQTRRGAEKWLFYATIVLATAFVAVNLALLFLNR